MAAPRELSTSELYLVTLRVIQPARLQDIVQAYEDIWAVAVTDALRSVVTAVHDKMRRDGYLVDVRKGTFVLDQRGMTIASRLLKERALDNARLFLLKAQRKRYHRFAGRHG